MRGNVDSSLISAIEWNDNVLTIFFTKKYHIKELTYDNVPLDIVHKLLSSNSAGQYYLQHIKHKFKFKLKSQNMADKIIKCKINVKEIKKEWLFVGEKGVYLNFTMLYNEEKDVRDNNGMLVQDVPTDIYKADKSIKGPILGNVKEFTKGDGFNKEASVGNNAGMTQGASAEDDLPF